MRQRFQTPSRALAAERLEARWHLSGDPIVSVATNFGDFQIELLPSAAPQSVANFLSYVGSGAYTNTIFHRSEQPSASNPGDIGIVQTGGFTSASSTFSNVSQFQTIPTNAPIPLEYNLPNTAGTVAMARTSSPNSATDQFFINDIDNSTTLGDGNSGGYAVFGKILGDGMQVINKIAALATTQADPTNQGSAFNQLPLGPNNQLVQITSITLDSIDGTVFSDANSNGQQDSGEPGIAGRTVFLDVDGSGKPDGNNPSTTTDANGNYAFSGLAPNSYTVREVLPAGGSLTTGAQTVTVSASSTASGVDFGEAPPSISGTVFNDVNLNGKFDAGEPGLAGVIVFLDVDGSGAPGPSNPSTVTNVQGMYSFEGLAAGSYAVREVVSPDHGTTLTTPNASAAVVAGQTASVNFGNALTSTLVPLPVSGNAPPPSSDANTAFINGVFFRLLGHAADSAGLAYWQGQLSSGVSHDALVQGVWDSTEHRGLVVEQFYHSFLGRASDPVGKAYWIDAFNSWGTEKIEAAGFVTSKEYSQDLHASDGDFVNALYQDIALRPADPAGAAFWTNALSNGKSRLDVAMAFINGQEASARVVEAFYSDFLHRTADASSLQAFVSNLQQDKTSVKDVGVNILGSDEYFNGVARQ